MLAAMATPTDSFGPHLTRDPVSKEFVMVPRWDLGIKGKRDARACLSPKPCVDS